MSEIAISELLNNVRAIAIEGMSYAQNEYDKARYEKLLALTSWSYSQITGIAPDKIKEIFLSEMRSITPKIGIDIGVCNTDDKILLLKRTDDHSWCLPSGWANVDEGPFQTAIREVKEETGLDIEPIGYAAIAHKGPKKYPGFVHQVNIAVIAEDVPTDVKVTLSHEHSDYRWITRDETVEWHKGHERIKNRLFEARVNKNILPYTE